MPEIGRRIDSISVFFPAYKEDTNIRHAVLQAKHVLDKIANKYEIIVIDDGSKDNTASIVRSLMKTDPSLHLIQHKKNKGYGAALISGFYGAHYPWIAFTDSDGQFDFSEITSFIQKQRKTKADLVIGYYKKRKVPFYRIVNSRIWELIIFLMFGLSVRDIDCGFKLVSKKVIDRIPRLEAQRGAFISTELLVKAKLFGFKIIEIPVTHYERKAGSATGSNIHVIISSFKDLFLLRKKLKKFR